MQAIIDESDNLQTINVIDKMDHAVILIFQHLATVQQHIHTYMQLCWYVLNIILMYNVHKKKKLKEQARTKYERPQSREELYHSVSTLSE